MRYLNRKNNGFSMTEVLIAVGTLAVGMIFIAGLFPAAILLTTEAAEQTVAGVVADEAFAKIRLYGVNLASELVDENDELARYDWVALGPFDPCEMTLYPSTEELGPAEKQYCWRALCRRVETGSRVVQVTVFVCRRAGGDPELQRYLVQGGADETVVEVPRGATLIGEGYMLVDERTGRLYRVVSRDDKQITLDKSWLGPDDRFAIWTIRPAEGTGRNPCIAVFQKVIQF